MHKLVEKRKKIHLLIMSSNLKKKIIGIYRNIFFFYLLKLCSIKLNPCIKECQKCVRMSRLHTVLSVLHRTSQILDSGILTRFQHLGPSESHSKSHHRAQEPFYRGAVWLFIQNKQTKLKISKGIHVINLYFDVVMALIFFQSGFFVVIYNWHVIW